MMPFDNARMLCARRGSVNSISDWFSTLRVGALDHGPEMAHSEPEIVRINLCNYRTNH